MNIYTNCSLLHYNTFGIQVRADMLVEYESVEELKQALALYHERMGAATCCSSAISKAWCCIPLSRATR